MVIYKTLHPFNNQANQMTMADRCSGHRNARAATCGRASFQDLSRAQPAKGRKTENLVEVRGASSNRNHAGRFGVAAARRLTDLRDR